MNTLFKPAFDMPTTRDEAIAVLGEWSQQSTQTFSHAKAKRIHELLVNSPVPFQRRVDFWMLECFGPVIAADANERNHRFLEESLELVQACGCSASEAHQLVDYVFDRPVGEKTQEVGGVNVTLAALCNAHQIDTEQAGQIELDRIWTKVEQIRAKQAAKPKHSPLPTVPAIEENRIDAERLRFLIDQDIEVNFPRSGLFIGRIPENEVLTGLDALDAIDEARGANNTNFQCSADYAREALLFRAFVDAIIADTTGDPLTPIQVAIKAAFSELEPTSAADVLNCINKTLQSFPEAS